MYHSEVVEDDTCPAVHLFLNDHIRAFEDVRERLTRGDHTDQLVVVPRLQIAHERGGPVDTADVGHYKRKLSIVGGSLGDFEDRTLQNGGFGVRIEMTVVVILVADVMGHQVNNLRRIPSIEDVNRFESVCKPRLAAYAFVVYAMEELEGWGLAHVEQVHVESQIFGGI